MLRHFHSFQPTRGTPIRCARPTLWLAIAVCGVTPIAVDARDFSRLGRDLTPLGAEHAGNADGSIPPWDGGLTRPPEGWNLQQGYVDPFPDDRPQLTITGANAAEHGSRLTPGMQALLARYAEFRMPVYATRRTAALPKPVTDAVVAQAPHVRLQGFGLANLGNSTTPFPIPQNGLEAIWNHLVRYLGGGTTRLGHSFPVRANGDYYRIGFRATRLYAANVEQADPNRLFYAVGWFTEPAALRGTAFLVHEPVDQVAESRSAWIYNSGARRVRRAPDLAYDGINDGSEGMLVTDQVDGYNGAPDRYDWTLVGKRELYVPYNTYRLSDKTLKYRDILGKHTLNADLMRYELHRVWVVEANLKPGQRHIYARRTFYLDEDSWSVLAEDAYDSRGGLWRIALHGLIQCYDAAVPWYRVSIYHDLDSRSYLAGGLDNENREPIRFGVKGTIRDFQPDALRRLGTQ
jgi:hypothetical protein